MIDELGLDGYRLSAGTPSDILHGMELEGYLRSRLTLNGGRNRRVYRATSWRQSARHGTAACTGALRRDVRGMTDVVMKR